MCPHISDTSDAYWGSDPGGLQRAKHSILRRYLKGWFPILASRNERLLYLDCCAGPGRHVRGQPGSPLIALDVLLEHDKRQAILDGTRIDFLFFEKIEKNAAALREEIRGLSEVPENVKLRCFHSDFSSELQRLLTRVRERRRCLPPFFGFVDPFGYSLSMELFNELLEYRSSELLINFMFSGVDRAFRVPAKSRLLDALFGTSEWRSIRSLEPVRRRLAASLDLFARQLNAKWVSPFEMRGENNAVKYVLLHATNHPKGREVMKDAMWSVDETGSFVAFENENPAQAVLFAPGPDLAKLRRAFLKVFSTGTYSGDQVRVWCHGIDFRMSHVNEVLNELEREGRLITSPPGRINVTHLQSLAVKDHIGPPD